MWENLPLSFKLIKPQFMNKHVHRGYPCDVGQSILNFLFQQTNKTVFYKFTNLFQLNSLSILISLVTFFLNACALQMTGTCALARSAPTWPNMPGKDGGMCQPLAANPTVPCGNNGATDQKDWMNGEWQHICTVFANCNRVLLSPALWRPVCLLAPFFYVGSLAVDSLSTLCGFWGYNSGAVCRSRD
jgi:hypothetical protein